MDRKMKILVVDDEIDFLNIVEKYLRLKQCGVRTCASGMEGIEVLKKEPYDLIIMDIKMPVMDGMETIKDMLKIDHNCGVYLIVTGFTVTQQMENFLREHKVSYDYLFKPFNMSDLTKKIDQMFQLVNDKKA